MFKIGAVNEQFAYFMLYDKQLFKHKRSEYKEIITRYIYSIIYFTYTYTGTSK